MEASKTGKPNETNMSFEQKSHLRAAKHHEQGRESKGGELQVGRKGNLMLQLSPSLATKSFTLRPSPTSNLPKEGNLSSIGVLLLQGSTTRLFRAPCGRSEKC